MNKIVLNLVSYILYDLAGHQSIHLPSSTKQIVLISTATHFRHLNHHHQQDQIPDCVSFFRNKTILKSILIGAGILAGGGERLSHDSVNG